MPRLVWQRHRSSSRVVEYQRKHILHRPTNRRRFLLRWPWWNSRMYHFFPQISECLSELERVTLRRARPKKPPKISQHLWQFGSNIFLSSKEENSTWLVNHMRWVLQTTYLYSFLNKNMVILPWLGTISSRVRWWNLWPKHKTGWGWVNPHQLSIDHNWLARSSYESNPLILTLGNAWTDHLATTLSYYDFACTPASVPPVLGVKACVNMKENVSHPTALMAWLILSLLKIPRCRKRVQEACIDSFDLTDCLAADNFCEQAFVKPYVDSGE